MKVAIPIEFFKAIGEKPHTIRIYWIKWLSDYTEHLFKPDFIEIFINDMKGKNLNLKTINEAYDFGITFFDGGFEFISDNKKPKSNISDSNLEIIRKVIEYLNEKSQSTYTMGKANIECINARIREGFSISDFYSVIDSKCHQWLGTEQQKYLRPITLFQAKKFENYLNEPQTQIKVNGKQKPPSSIDKLSSAVDKAKKYFQ
jgi:uncharacterized phage protein (TIGR02220 family)